MKLAPRMTLVIGSCALLLFATSGLFQLRSEEHDLRAVAEKELLLLGRSLQTAFENAIRDRQIEDVEETLGALAPIDPTVAIFVFDEQGSLVGASRGATPSEQALRTEAIARGAADPVVGYSSRDGAPALLLGLRLREEEVASASAIVLEKPLHELQRDLAQTRRTIWFTTSLLVLSVAASTWGLTRRYVGSPLRRLVANMRRVGAGDLRITLGPKTDDEVGEAQQEFERLVHALRMAGMRADSELEARRRIERGLQDADKLITLGQLSAVMAHEIGSPLQILEGRARALVKHAEDARATRRIAHMLIEQTERVTRIVRQMLSITRRRIAVRSVVDAEASVRSVVALLELEARRRQVRFLVERTGRTDVLADGDQLQQIALNLLRNALDATPRGSAVTVRIGGDDDRLVLEVQDAGPGVPEAVRGHLFEPFFTTKAESGGSGLGLLVVKSIVQEHGGRVDFAEDESPGCLVRVQLPRAGEGASP